MYEVWISNEEPALHMVRKTGSDASAAVELRLWSRAGETEKISSELAREIEADGYSTVLLHGAAFDPQTEIERSAGKSSAEDTARELRGLKVPGSGS